EDINAQDREGNTSLHEAVEMNHTTSIACLLAHGAKTEILNRKNMAPTHLAVDLNRIDSLKELLSHSSSDPNVPGENGSTPLHYAAWKDRPECARILVS
ncbi:hypothetical protein HELRODRAFT_73601, partial [Helobdella robusta]|uniref:Uncharacterized protein n=1 Tax=Helobdella robusta TaxID=6412 RepID=T1G1G3_HELRO